jgi:hypothetical protein
VANGQKILSLYDPEVRVIVRGGVLWQYGFAGGKNRQGVILDYEFFRQGAPADSQLLFGSVAAGG